MKLQVKRKRPRIEIVPMIDVIFFMLVFFMIFATFKTAQTGVKVDLPKTTHLGENEQNTAVISITRDGRVFFGKQEVSLAELRVKTATVLQKDQGSQFVIKPDATVGYQDLIKVMDIMAEAGVTHPLLGVDRQQIPNNAAQERKNDG